MTFNRRLFLQGVIAPCLASLGWANGATADAGLVLVAVISPSSTLTDISLGTLRRVFLGEPIDGPSGTHLIGFNHPPKTRPRVLFDSVVLGMSPDEAARYWVDQRIRGGSRPPRNVANVELLRQVVRQLPGAISYLPLSEVDSNVRILTLSGLGPDSSRYPLR